jgi:hypothetical protein
MGSGASAKKTSSAEKGPVDIQKLQSVLDRFNVTIAEANDLAVLQDYEIVILADDSGSMTCGSLPPNQRVLGGPCPTRWSELKDTVGLLVEIGSCFDPTGINIFFLNRPPVKNVKKVTDSKFQKAFSSGPSGTTPLTEKLCEVASATGGERPVLLFMLTDGQPNGGVARFRERLRAIVKKESNQHTFKVQIMACTDEDEAVGYLDEIDREFPEVDVTDDYYSEMLQVLKDVRNVKQFTRGDWCMKAMLGPVSSKFDAWDEKQSSPNALVGGA